MSDLTDLRDLFNSLADHFSAKYAEDITYREVFAAVLMRLGDKFDMEHPVHVWAIKIDFQTAVNELDDFDFSSIKQAIVFENPMIPFEIRFQQKAAFKAAGENWIIHRYDADPFPSNPHAHNEDNNLKLDLSNGNLYRNRKLKGTIRRKDLLLIREQAKRVYKGTLPPCSLI